MEHNLFTSFHYAYSSVSQVLFLDVSSNRLPCRLLQRDQILKLKVAQCFPKVAQKVAKAVFT